MKPAKSNRSRELCLLVSLLFLIFFNFPLILIFNRTNLVFGIPMLILHLLGGWLLFIIVISLIARNLDEKEDGERPGGDRGRNGS